MKTILVPFDFSGASDNALNYAIAFAKTHAFGLAVLHVSEFTTISADPQVLVPNAYALIEAQQERMDDIRADLLEQHGDGLKVTCYCETGFVNDTISHFAEQHQVELIIMGMQGGGYLTEKIIGSTTTSLMRTSPRPVLGIPRLARYKPVKRIALASDYKDAAYADILVPLKRLIALYDAHLYVLHIDRDKLLEDKEVIPSRKLQHALEDIPYTLHSLPDTGVAEGLTRLVDDLAIDLVVMVPREHSFIYSLLHEPATKKLAFRTPVPILALPEKPED
jgi:nucleotide-binding universal stress UspA family protein